MCVKNLSNRKLTQSEENVFSKGLNLAVTTQHVTEDEMKTELKKRRWKDKHFLKNVFLVTCVNLGQ